MKLIENKITALRQFDPTEVILDTALERSQDITDLVTEIQLYAEGVRGSDGEPIMAYDPYKALTIAIKTYKNQPTDRVTLRDTGDFHKSFEVQPETDGFKITATDPKTDELMARYGAGIMALTDEHLDKVRKEIFMPALQEAFLKAWNDG